MYTAKSIYFDYAESVYPWLPLGQRIERHRKICENVFGNLFALFQRGLASESLLYLSHLLTRGEEGRLDLRYGGGYIGGLGEIDNPHFAVRWSNLALCGIRDLEHIKKIGSENKLILQDLFEALFALVYSGLVNDLSDEQIKENIERVFLNQRLNIEGKALSGFIKQLRLDLKDPWDVFWLQQTQILPELERLTREIFAASAPPANGGNSRVITQLLGMFIYGVLRGDLVVAKGFLRVAREGYFSQVGYLVGRLIRAPPFAWSALPAVFILALFRPLASVKAREITFNKGVEEDLCESTRNSLIIHEKAHLKDKGELAALKAQAEAFRGFSLPPTACSERDVSFSRKASSSRRAPAPGAASSHTAMQERIAQLQPLFIEITQKLKRFLCLKADEDFYILGGFPRDLLSGRTLQEIREIDVVIVTGDRNRIGQLKCMLRNSGQGACIKLDGILIDLFATEDREGKLYNERGEELPQVDFSVNNLRISSKGELLADERDLKDLERRIIRSRFSHIEYAEVLRVILLKHKLGFSLDKKLEEAIFGRNRVVRFLRRAAILKRFNPWLRLIEDEAFMLATKDIFTNPLFLNNVSDLPPHIKRDFRIYALIIKIFRDTVNPQAALEDLRRIGFTSAFRRVNKDLLSILVSVGLSQNTRLKPAGLSGAEEPQHLKSDSISVDFKKLDQQIIGQLDRTDRDLLNEILKAEPKTLKRIMEQFKDKVYIKLYEKADRAAGRTVYLVLKRDRPVIAKGRRITVLRIKGIRPRIKRNNLVRTYGRKWWGGPRRGYVDIHDAVDDRGGFYQLGPDAGPWGTALAYKAENEFIEMCQSGRDFDTDYPVGWGILSGRKFIDKKRREYEVGFLIAGMEGRDIRLNMQKGRLIGLDMLTGDIISLKEDILCTKLGAAFREFHRLGRFHRFPHTDNIGIIIGQDDRYKIVMRHLGTTVRRESLSAEADIRIKQEVAYRYLDLQRPMDALGECANHSLLEIFLDAYFGAERRFGKEYAPVVLHALANNNDSLCYQLLRGYLTSATIKDLTLQRGSAPASGSDSAAENGDKNGDVSHFSDLAATALDKTQDAQGGRWPWMQKWYDRIGKNRWGQAVAPAAIESGLAPVLFISFLMVGGAILSWLFGLPLALAPPLLVLAYQVLWHLLHIPGAPGKDFREKFKFAFAKDKLRVSTLGLTPVIILTFFSAIKVLSISPVLFFILSILSLFFSHLYVNTVTQPVTLPQVSSTAPQNPAVATAESIPAMPANTEPGCLDGMTILSFAHAYDTVGGVQYHLQDLNHTLLGRHKNLTIIQIYLTKDKNNRDISIEERGNGSKLIKVPICLPEESAIGATDKIESRFYRIAKCLLAPLRIKNSLALRLNNPRLAVFLVRIPVIKRFYDSPLNADKIIEKTREVLDQYKVNLVVVHSFFMNSMILLTREARKRNIPILFQYHGDNRFFAKSIVDMVDGIGGISELNVPKAARAKFRNLSNGINTEFFRLENASPPNFEHPIVLLPARIHTDKGCLDFVRIARIIKDNGQRVTLIFGGPEAEEGIKDKIIALAKEEGLLPEDIKFSGELTQVQIRDYYAASDVVVLPSFSEGLGRVLLEAQAMQRPVIAYNVGGVPEAMRDGITGYLVQKGDIATFAQRLQELLSDRETRTAMGRAGRKFVESKFTLTQLAQRHEAWYLEILREKKNQSAAAPPAPGTSSGTVPSGGDSPRARGACHERDAALPKVPSSRRAPSPGPESKKGVKDESHALCARDWLQAHIDYPQVKDVKKDFQRVGRILVSDVKRFARKRKIILSNPEKFEVARRLPDGTIRWFIPEEEISPDIRHYVKSHERNPSHKRAIKALAEVFRRNKRNKLLTWKGFERGTERLLGALARMTKRPEKEKITNKTFAVQQSIVKAGAGFSDIGSGVFPLAYSFDYLIKQGYLTPRQFPGNIILRKIIKGVEYAWCGILREGEQVMINFQDEGALVNTEVIRTAEGYRLVRSQPEGLEVVPHLDKPYFILVSQNGVVVRDQKGRKINYALSGFAPGKTSLRQLRIIDKGGRLLSLFELMHKHGFIESLQHREQFEQYLNFEYGCVLARDLKGKVNLYEAKSSVIICSSSGQVMGRRVANKINLNKGEGASNRIFASPLPREAVKDAFQPVQTSTYYRWFHKDISPNKATPVILELKGSNFFYPYRDETGQLKEEPYSADGKVHARFDVEKMEHPYVVSKISVPRQDIARVWVYDYYRNFMYELEFDHTEELDKKGG
jgi:glycosyltransferase involved in cell wall biosynthesis